MAIEGLGLAARLLMLLAFAALTYSVKNAIILFHLELLISPVGIPKSTAFERASLVANVYHVTGQKTVRLPGNRQARCKKPYPRKKSPPPKSFQVWYISR